MAADTPVTPTGVNGASPSISAEWRAKFWRSQAERIAAETAAERGRAAYESVVSEMRKACGGAELVMGANGEPTCQPKPEGPKETKPQ